MSSSMPQVPNTEIDTVKVVHMRSRRFVEVETSFTRRHKGELFGFWNVKKNDTDVHKFKYNNQDENPLLESQGWNEFRDHHDLPANVVVTLTYLGNNNFEVSHSEEIISSSQLPPFHSRSINPSKTTYFDIELANAQIGLPTFKLRHDFATFLHGSHDLNSFYLCGDNGYRFHIRVLHPNNVSRMRLNNWDMVCEYQKLKVGDVIRFKFEIDVNFVSKRCHLIKMS